VRANKKRGPREGRACLAIQLYFNYITWQWVTMP
jgi:hypothetical protein